MLSPALERNLERQWIQIKPNFRKSYWKYIEHLEETQTDIESIKKRTNRLVFVYLNRANAKKRTKTTSPLTAIVWDKYKNYWTIKNFQTTKKICSSSIYQSITWMQNGRWMIIETDFQKLIELCSLSWELDTALLKSITWMQKGRWMIDEKDFYKLIELCTFNKTLDKELLSSITWMQNGRWMISAIDFQKLIELCTINWVLDRQLLHSITSKQSWIKPLLNQT